MPKVDSQEIAHLWAHQRYESATAGAAVSFNGPAFLSFSTVIASIVDGPKGKAYLLAEPSSYSPTTSKHQNWARVAVPHTATVFTVPPVKRNNARNSDFPDHTRIMDGWRSDLTSAMNQLLNHRSFPKAWAHVNELSATMHRYVEFFELTGDVAHIPELPETASDALLILQQEQERKEALKAKREEAERLKYQKELEAWLSGSGSGYIPQSVGTHLRIVGDEVETTLGAKVPVSHAKRALTLIEKVMARGKEWNRNGEQCRVGHYQIDSIKADGTVYAGCHVIKYEAVQRIADQLRVA